MNKITLLAFMFVLFLLSSGCATYSKDQCVDFDWKKRGYLHALKGSTLEAEVSSLESQVSGRETEVTNLEFEVSNLEAMTCPQ